MPRHSDACGLGFVASRSGGPSRETLDRALDALRALDHRGGRSADGGGDGAGIATQIPRRLLSGPIGAVGMVFLPIDGRARAAAQCVIEEELERAGCASVWWRDVPCDPSALCDEARASLPVIRQVVAGDPPHDQTRSKAERALYFARRRAQKRFAAGPAERQAYICSLSNDTIVYKALCGAHELDRFYTDLRDPAFESNAAVFHRRFSTNTAPSWPLVQPLRLTAHNGEFNTLAGNVSWLRAREGRLGLEAFGEHASDVAGVVNDTDSDSVTFDRLFELLTVAGRDPEAVMSMLCPEPHAHMPDMAPDVRAMCRYNSELIEPWDGPAAIVFFDGRTIGAGLDRNGLRPFRYEITSDGWVLGGSEAGMLGAGSDVIERGRLGPGGSFSVDLRTGDVRRNNEIKRALAAKHPYATWVDDSLAERAVGIDDTEAAGPGCVEPDLVRRQLAFGYAREDIERIIGPMSEQAKSPVGSMGDDTPLAAMSERPQALYRFFKQRFAQVTNPAIDSIRERLNMSLETSLGRYADVLGTDPGAVRCTRLDSPIIGERDLVWLCNLARRAGPGEAVATIDCTFPAGGGGEALHAAIDRIADGAVEAVRAGVGLVILSDRAVSRRRAPAPMLLAVGAVHERLIQEGIRLDCSLICDTGEPREDHHVACLIGMGATLVLPHLAFETIREAAETDDDREHAVTAYRNALETGLLKIMGRMGVTVIQSYRGAGLFEIIGLDAEITRACFPTAAAFPGSVGWDRIAGYQCARHAQAFGEAEASALAEDGTYRFRKNGETHARAPAVFKALHKAVRSASHEDYERYTGAVASLPPVQPRDLMEWNHSETPLDLSRVEPIEKILPRLSVQAMSHGALSREAHETLARGANRLGVRSNSGEGGEAADRLVPVTVNGDDNPQADDGEVENLDHGSSAVKQVASGRFGVTNVYLASARELEIKMAQGAKPGEGGQIPGFKVTPEIAAMRHTVPGTPLISPPPHHDIYSIEDLAQLIDDLKTVRPDTPVAVKLVSTLGIGTIACGVAKAGADVIVVSGADGGTGAAQLSSIKHAGLPWEIGLGITQRALVDSGLREHVRLRTDGGMATGRDAVTAAMLGADEVGFGTTALIAAGCVMARRCHDNTCPVGVATQDERLRAKFPGEPEHVVALFAFLAEEIRGHLSSLGVARFGDLTGCVERLRARQDRERALDTDAIIAAPAADLPRRSGGERNRIRPLRGRVNAAFLRAAEDAIEGRAPARFESDVSLEDGALGASVAGLLGHRALEGKASPAPIEGAFRGAAGQSFGAFCAAPMRLELVGVAQDGVGKCMSGGEIIIRSAASADADGTAAPPGVLAGNALLYGATGGSASIAGVVGERFCVRNSGGIAVAEGCGDHGCEYMTGGRVALLGPIGRNFAAGMTGGIAYVLDTDGYLERHVASDVTIGLLDEADQAVLLQLLEWHAARSGSRVAEDLLTDPDAAMSRFLAVRPPGLGPTKTSGAEDEAEVVTRSQTPSAPSKG